MLVRIPQRRVERLLPSSVPPEGFLLAAIDMVGSVLGGGLARKPQSLSRRDTRIHIAAYGTIRRALGGHPIIREEQLSMAISYGTGPALGTGALSASVFTRPSAALLIHSIYW